MPLPAVIHSLTSLRFLAAAWVVFFHFKEFFPDTALQESRFAGYGFLGVDFFFVLSGFVLAHVYLPKVREQRFDYWSFLVRRIGRIYPLHVLTLAVTIGLCNRRKFNHICFVTTWIKFSTKTNTSNRIRTPSSMTSINC